LSLWLDKLRSSRTQMSQLVETSAKSCRVESEDGKTWFCVFRWAAAFCKAFGEGHFADFRR
jgi:hypothetical protein